MNFIVRIRKDERDIPHYLVIGERQVASQTTDKSKATRFPAVSDAYQAKVKHFPKRKAWVESLVGNIGTNEKEILGKIIRGKFDTSYDKDEMQSLINIALHHEMTDLAIDMQNDLFHEFPQNQAIWTNR